MANFGIFWFQTSAQKLVILPEGLVGFLQSLFETTKVQAKQPRHHVLTVSQSVQTGSEVRQDSCSKGRKSYFVGGKALGVCGLYIRLHPVPLLRMNSAVFPLSNTLSWYANGQIFLYLTFS